MYMLFGLNGSSPEITQKERYATQQPSYGAHLQAPPASLVRLGCQTSELPSHGCFHRFELLCVSVLLITALLFGVCVSCFQKFWSLIIRAPLFGVYYKAPDFWKLPHPASHGNLEDAWGGLVRGHKAPAR